MIFWYDTLDSTNNYTRDHICEFDNLSVIATKCQTRGRGQGNHTWTSEPGSSLTFTIVLHFGDDCILEAKDAILITHLTTRAIRRFLSEAGVKSSIKWPNDIYCSDRKICGILIENILKGKYVQSSIVGVGVNLNQAAFPEDLPNPVSLFQLTGKTQTIESALERLSEYFSDAFNEAKTLQGREALKCEFDANVFFPGK